MMRKRTFACSSLSIRPEKSGSLNPMKRLELCLKFEQTLRGSEFEILSQKTQVDPILVLFAEALGCGLERLPLLSRETIRNLVHANHFASKGIAPLCAPAMDSTFGGLAQAYNR